MTDPTRAATFATPVAPSGDSFLNIPTSTYTQVETGAGVFSGLSVNAGGTTSSAALYDGTSNVVTITIASPGVISWAAHPFVAGGAVKFQTTSALPTGLVAGTTYYVSTVGLAAGSFRVADTRAHALAGTNTVNTSGSQSGVQTAYDVSRLIGTFATTAIGNVPAGLNGAATTKGLIAITADGGGAADLTVYYR